jgi:hypothetical protein
MPRLPRRAIHRLSPRHSCEELTPDTRVRWTTIECYVDDNDIIRINSSYVPNGLHTQWKTCTVSNMLSMLVPQILNKSLHTSSAVTCADTITHRTNKSHSICNVPSDTESPPPISSCFRTVRQERCQRHFKLGTTDFVSFVLLH